ncbi:hypothetical protein Ahy_B10g104663 [Arachis hypogaea]|uniref:Protein FAR1-RELATED SEQUENCE n=1 Tax=Arachis hypogaea TaxID=3818 RepID=A0A444X675_ARAHY|nr:hypothetical protein Ahy_B10g104663 [Arachis hypogaea]
MGLERPIIIAIIGYSHRVVCDPPEKKKSGKSELRMQEDGGIWWCEMESDLEDSSKFSGQWTDGWSIGSEANECETLGTELGQPEEVNMTLLDTEETSRVANDAKAQESSPATVRSDEEPNSSNCFVAGVTAEDLALAEFDSVEEAHARYVEYARATGFAVRKGDSGKDNEDKGYGKWKMKSFVADHNHELAPADHTNVMAPHHHMSEENNEWIGKTDEKREHWANAYLCDKFCAGVRTTSRCEGINSLLKKFIRSGNYLLELVENLDRVVKDYRNNEFMADFKCLYSEPVMTTGLESIKKVVSKVYTLGVPCSHIFCAMKELEIEVLPTRLVLRRWCKDEKSLVSVGAVPVADPEKAFRVCYGSLWSACMSMYFLAAQDRDTYENVLSEVAKLTKEIEATGPRGGMN